MHIIKYIYYIFQQFFQLNKISKRYPVLNMINLLFRDFYLFLSISLQQ